MTTRPAKIKITPRLDVETRVSLSAALDFRAISFTPNSALQRSSLAPIYHYGLNRHLGLPRLLRGADAGDLTSRADPVPRADRVP